MTPTPPPVPGQMPPSMPGLPNPYGPTGREGKAKFGYLGGWICAGGAMILLVLSIFGYANYTSCHEIFYATIPLGILVTILAGLDFIPAIMGMRSLLKSKARLGLILAIVAMVICIIVFIVSAMGLFAHEAYSYDLMYNDYYYY